jgi:hypothetical protein
MSDWRDQTMNAAQIDPYLVPLVLFCVAVITIGAIVTVLNRVPRAEFAQLKNEFKRLSELVRVLEASEQRRFVRELNSHRTVTEGAEAKYATNGSGRLEAESPVRSGSAS